MDNQFTTLTRSYYDNYLQYKLTGNASYQNSYMSAEEGIQNILKSLEDQISSNTENVNSFYSSDVEEKMRDTQSQLRSTGKNIIKNTDRAIGASMRNIPQSSFSLPTSYLISIGVLSATAFLLSAL